MGEAELKARLERVLGRISLAEWLDLRDANVQREYDDLSWDDFRDWAREMLDRLRLHDQRKRLEQIGQLEIDIESSGEETAPPPNIPGTLSDRTTARSRALGALDHLRAGYLPVHGSRISSTHKPRGGVDRTIPQWVIFMGVEAWIPAEEVADSYREHQQALLAEPKPSRTHAKAFQVAAFVWDQERVHGARPPWQVLCERWNADPLTTPFENWKSFRMAFERGANATRPRYFATVEQLTEQVRSRRHEGALDSWVNTFRE